VSFLKGSKPNVKSNVVNQYPGCKKSDTLEKCYMNRPSNPRKKGLHPYLESLVVQCGVVTLCCAYHLFIHENRIGGGK
jgi:hypothetical protein